MWKIAERARMRVIVFDTETTGLRPGYICQLAYIISDADGQITEAKNYYFKVSFMPTAASRVHGLTADALLGLSSGLAFADRAGEIEAAFAQSSLWVAHNIDFDRAFLMSEFRHSGIALHEARNFCTMRELAKECKLPSTKPGGRYKFPTLAQAAAHLGISDSDISKCREEAFGNVERRQYHEARYDAAATYLCYRRAVAMGIAP
jgi:DNA polymerase-3 subunit epsilon